MYSWVMQQSFVTQHNYLDGRTEVSLQQPNSADSHHPAYEYIFA